MIKDSALNVIFIFLLSLFSLVGCHPSSSEKANEIATMKIVAKNNNFTLYYTGTIKPIQMITVSNVQTEGFIAEKNFEYGDKVTKGQLLFVITSQQLSKNFQDAVSGYVKAKKNYADVKFQMNASEELKKLQIESEQNYATAKSQMFNAELDFAQAGRQLQNVLIDLGISDTDLSKFDHTDPKTINEILAHAPNSIKRFAPATGIALLPEAGGFSKEDSQGPLTVGSLVKAGQNLLIIGDMSGISINIKITEINVHKINTGQKAIVTSDAFSTLKMTGYIEHIDQQASNSDRGMGGSGMPTFSAKVVVPRLTEAELDKIRVGMSAEIAVPLENPNVIQVPLSALYLVNHKQMVKIINPKTKAIEEINVRTGRTSQDSVEIMEGLKNGDEVVINATTH